MAEVTFRTPAAVEAIRVLAAEPEFLVGAGTVVRPEQVDVAVEAGAQFIVSPGFSDEVVRRCAALDVPVAPGRRNRDRGDGGTRARALGR